METKYLGHTLNHAYMADEDITAGWVWRVFSPEGIMLIDDYGNTKTSIYDDCKIKSAVKRKEYMEIIIDLEQPKSEDKEEIIKALLPVLQMTRNLSDLTGMEYVKTDSGETVSCVFRNGTVKFANVTFDSGTTMIKDIINQII